jgi:hypothetical protein
MQGSSNKVPSAPNVGQSYTQGVQAQLAGLKKQLPAEYGYRQEYDPKYIEQQQQLQQQYGPTQYGQQLTALGQLDPTGVATRNALAGNVGQYLAQGSLNPQQAAAYGQYMNMASNAAAQGGWTPEQAQAYKALGQSTTGQLLRGTQMDPAQTEQLANQVRAGQAARGNISGNAPEMAEAVYMGQRGQQLLQQRQGASGAYLGLQNPAGQAAQGLLVGSQAQTPQAQALASGFGFMQSRSPITDLAGVQGVQAPTADQYVNPYAGSQGQQFALQNYQNLLGAQQLNQQNNPWTSILGTAGTIAGSYYGAGGAAAGGQAGSALGSYFSSRKLKRDIVKVGEKDGLDIVEFSYINGHCRYRGVLAEQVQREFPDAVADADGFLKVDYQKIGIPFLKQCKACGTFKDINDFKTASDTIDGHIGKCKTCIGEYMSRWEQSNSVRRRKARNDWKADHPGWHRNWWLKKNYGISLIEFNRLAEEQKGLCLICEELPGKRGLHADHCHTNGGVRGLLCFRCNAGLGLFRHNPKLLVNAIDYLTPQVVEKEA